MNPVAKAGYFGVLFDKAPTYDEIVSGTQKLAAPIDINKLFIMKNSDSGYVAGCESLTWHPILLDFILIGKKLEKLGFVYYRGNVLVSEQE